MTGHTQGTRNVTQYLNEQLPDQWIGHDGPQNWPPLSPDFNPRDFHVWAYIRNVVYESKLGTRDEIVQRISDAARRVNDAAFLPQSNESGSAYKLTTAILNIY
jgi:hypothetical protein